MADAMLPAELAAVTHPLNEDDQLLAADELALLSLFDELKKAPNFERFPGTTVLRRCRKGRVLVSQGEAGATAYTILTTEDVIKIRELQLSKVTKSLAVAVDKELRQQQRDIEAELVTLRQSRDAFVASKTLPNQRPAASAVLLLNDGKVAKKGLFNRFAGFFASSASSSKGSSMIPIDGPADMDSKTRRIALNEGELFGEMSCMNRAPRSATVVADRDCYMLEMLRNVLDMLHKDEKYKQKLDDFGVFGISGVLLILLSLIMATQDFVLPNTQIQWQQFQTNSLIVLGSVAVVGILFFAQLLLLDSLPGLKRFQLRTPAVDGTLGAAGTDLLASTQSADLRLPNVGELGVAESVLRPSGKVLFNKQLVDVVTEGDYLDPGTPVEVIRREGNRIIVRKV